MEGFQLRGETVGIGMGLTWDKSRRKSTENATLTLSSISTRLLSLFLCGPAQLKILPVIEQRMRQIFQI